ncbi:SWIM zinc finger family protein [Cedecea sp. S5-13]|uniref:SWIM zinc finger family protein n=1 Tax=Cedecea selenatireducens TaxID=3144416 RepID=UPI0035CD2A20
MIIELLATSSSGSEFYKVTVSDDANPISITCSCYAGSSGTMCRHRIALLTNKTRCMYSSKNNEASSIKNAIDILKKSGLSEKYISLENKISVLEKKYKEEKKLIKQEINSLI